MSLHEHIAARSTILGGVSSEFSNHVSTHDVTQLAQDLWRLPSLDPQLCLMPPTQALLSELQ